LFVSFFLGAINTARYVNNGEQRIGYLINLVLLGRNEWGFILFFLVNLFFSGLTFSLCHRVAICWFI